MAQGYKVISISRTGIDGGNATFCENCGRTIFNFAIIRNMANNSKFRVGLDCMHTLCKKNNTQARQLSINF